MYLARPARLRRVRQESGGPGPSGQRGQTGDLRGGARSSSHRPPQRLAVAAHREPGWAGPRCGAHGGGRFSSEVYAGDLPRLPGRPARPQAPGQPGGDLRSGPEAAACAQVLLPRGLQRDPAVPLLQVSCACAPPDGALEGCVQAHLGRSSFPHQAPACKAQKRVGKGGVEMGEHSPQSPQASLSKLL